MLIYEYKGAKYPEYLKHGNAVEHITPSALHFCLGTGYDVGAGKWPLPGSVPIDLTTGGDAYNLPSQKLDYVFSSHCLEHLPDTVKAIEHWRSRIKPGGCLFLYLPSEDMEYWLPQNNRKHLHVFHPSVVATMLRDLGFINVVYSMRDLYWSFAVVGFLPSNQGSIDACERYTAMVTDAQKFFKDDPQMLAIHQHFGADAFRRSSLFDGLEDILRKYKIRGSRAVEIGTFNGITALVLARYFDEVFTFDVFPHTSKRTIATLAGVSNVKFIDVKDNAEKADYINSIDFDFAYVDGNHAADTQSDWDLVNRCGRVLLHEYWEQQRPVWDLVNKLKAGPGKVDVHGKMALWTA